MENSELVKILDWVKENYSDSYEKWSPYGYDNEFDINNNSVNLIDYPIMINDIKIKINFGYRLPTFSKELGFIGGYYYIDIFYNMSKVDRTHEDCVVDIKSIDEFLESFNSIREV